MHYGIRRLPVWLALAAVFTACVDDLPTGASLESLTPTAAPSYHLASDGVPFHGLADDFSGDALDEDRWILISPPERVTVDDRLAVAVAPQRAEAIKLMDRAPQDFRGSGYQVEISQYATGSSTLGTFLAVTDSAELSYVIFNAFGGQLTAWYRWSGQNPVQLSGSLPLDPVNHRFLRLREEGGSVYYETSSDGSTWTERWSVVHALPQPEQMRGMLGVQAWGSLPRNPTPAIFEGVNTLAPAAPRAFTATFGGPLQVDLSWQDHSVNEVEFRVQRREAGSGDFLTIASLPANIGSYSDSTVLEDVTYEYRVKAVGPTGAISVSRTAEITALAEPPPLPPSLSELVDDLNGPELDLDLWTLIGPAEMSNLDNRLELTPRTISGTDHLFLRNRLPRSFAGATFGIEVSQFAGGNSTTETFVGVYSLDEEEYVAISVHNNRVSAWYKWRHQQDFTQIGSTITLNAVQHRFLRVRESGGTVHYETSPDGHSWTSRWTTQHQFEDIHDLYGYAGIGTWGSPNTNPTAAFIESINSTVPATPRDLVATGGPEQVHLQWMDRSANESGFQIERRLFGGGAFDPVGSVPANVTTFVDEGLTADETYEYRVRAYGPAGTSAFTAIAAATATADTVPPPPPSIAELVDDFSGTSLDVQLWDARVSPGGLLVDDGLQLSVTPNAIEANALMSLQSYRFQDSAFQVQISQFATGSATIGTFAAVTDAAENSYVIFNVFNGRLTAWRRWNGGTPVQLGSITLNTAQHRFLRLRESAGRVYYETSADGAQWTTRWNVAHGFSNLDDLHGMIGIQTWGTPTSNPTPARFESVGIVAQ